MEPTKDDPEALVELVDVLLRDGAVVQADVVVTVADVPLVGISLRAAVAGMTTMADYGLLADWDEAVRDGALASGTADPVGPGDPPDRLAGPGGAADAGTDATGATVDESGASDGRPADETTDVDSDPRSAGTIDNE